MEFLGLGRLPGDIELQAGRATIPFPIVSALVVSALITVVAGVVSYAM